MRIDDIFYIIQGHQITDEELYKIEGDVPVYTSKNELKGYWDKAIITKTDLPCITYPTKANAGNAYIQKELFDANNTAVLIPKENWRNKIYLDWFVFKLQNIFLSIATSKDGVSYLNKEIVEAFEIDIPDKKIQMAMMKKIQPILSIHENISNLIFYCEQLQNKTFTHTYNNFQVLNTSISKILDYIGGNSGLTEREVYQKILSDSDKYKILSGTIDTDSGLGYVSRFAIKGKHIKVFEDREGILVVRKGKAGQTTFLDRGKYTLTDDAYILYQKEECDFKISLKWLQLQYQNVFYEYSSSSDNGTWNMTGFFNNVNVDIPSYVEQIAVVKLYDELSALKSNLNRVEKKINTLFDKKLE